jgi:hypothetical protein
MLGEEDKLTVDGDAVPWGKNDKARADPFGDDSQKD